MQSWKAILADLGDNSCRVGRQFLQRREALFGGYFCRKGDFCREERLLKSTNKKSLHNLQKFAFPPCKKRLPALQKSPPYSAKRGSLLCKNSLPILQISPRYCVEIASLLCKTNLATLLKVPLYTAIISFLLFKRSHPTLQKLPPYSAKIAYSAKNSLQK